MRTVADVCSSLSECGVVFKRYDHPPVATCEDASRHLQGVDGVGSNNRRIFGRSVPVGPDSWRAV